MNEWLLRIETRWLKASSLFRERNSHAWLIILLYKWFVEMKRGTSCSTKVSAQRLCCRRCEIQVKFFLSLNTRLIAAMRLNQIIEVGENIPCTIIACVVRLRLTDAVWITYQNSSTLVHADVFMNSAKQIEFNVEHWYLFRKKNDGNNLQLVFFFVLRMHVYLYCI